MQGQASTEQHSARGDAPSPAAQRDACLRLASVFRGALEAAAPGAGGAAPGEERLAALHDSLAAVGELFPQQRAGLLAMEDALLRAGDAQPEAEAAPSVATASGDEPANAEEDSLDAQAAGANTDTDAPGASLRTDVSASASLVLSWLKAGQIWMLCEAGARAELEAACWCPGLGAAPVSEAAPQGALPHADPRLAAALAGRGERGAAGLLLRAAGDMQGALAQWQDEFEAQRERAECLRVPAGGSSAVARPQLSNGAAAAQDLEVGSAPLDASECRTLEEHAVAHAEASARPAAAAAARALMAAARGADVLCGVSNVAEGSLSDGHVGWLLQMPSQCALGVLCSRPDLRAGDLFSPCHDVGGGDDNGFDAAQLWLQVRRGSCLQGAVSFTINLPLTKLPRRVQIRYQRVCAARGAESADCESRLHCLSQIARLAGMQHGAPPQHGDPAPGHPLYGPQPHGFALEDTWMAPEFVAALHSPLAAGTVTALAAPLRLVACALHAHSSAGAPITCSYDGDAF